MRNYTASNVVCALVGNKCDLPGEREVSVEEAEEVVGLIPEILFQIETSAKENTNVENAFAKIAEELMVSCDEQHKASAHVTITNLFVESSKQRR